MNFRTYKLIVSLLIVSFLGATCETSPHETGEPVTEGMELRNGVLWFENEGYLMATMQELGHLGEEQLIEWVYAQGFTNSLLLSYYGNEQEPEHLLNKVSMSKYYAALLSTEGLLAAGDTMVWLQSNAEYVFFEATKNDLKIILKNQKPNSKYIVNLLDGTASAGTTTILGSPNTFFWPEQGETKTLFSFLDASILWWNKHFSITFYHNYDGKVDINWKFDYQIRERNGSNKCEAVSYYGMEENRNFFNVNKMVIIEYEFWHDGRGGCFCWKDAASEFTFRKDGISLGSGGIQAYRDDCRK